MQSKTLWGHCKVRSKLGEKEGRQGASLTKPTSSAIALSPWYSFGHPAQRKHLEQSELKLNFSWCGRRGSRRGEGGSSRQRRPRVKVWLWGITTHRQTFTRGLRCPRMDGNGGARASARLFITLEVILSGVFLLLVSNLVLLQIRLLLTALDPPAPCRVYG